MLEERLIRTSGHNNDDFDDNGNANIEYYCWGKDWCEPGHNDDSDGEDCYANIEYDC